MTTKQQFPPFRERGQRFFGKILLYFFSWCNIRGAVGQQLVLLDDNVPLDPDAAKVAELDQSEVRLEHQDVVQLDVEVTEVLGVDPLQS